MIAVLSGRLSAISRQFSDVRFFGFCLGLLALACGTGEPTGEGRVYGMHQPLL